MCQPFYNLIKKIYYIYYIIQAIYYYTVSFHFLSGNILKCWKVFIVQLSLLNTGIFISKKKKI